MDLVNDMTPAERAAHDDAKRVCPACEQSGRRLRDRRFSEVRWTGATWFPPRTFVDARVQIIEEDWACDPCASKPVGITDRGDLLDRSVVGTTVDFRHIGQPEELVAREALAPSPEARSLRPPRRRSRAPAERGALLRDAGDPDGALPLRAALMPTRQGNHG